MKRASAASNPVLIGAVTVLVTTVAVFLAYNANNGLPFVPTTTVTVRVENGANLVAGNEVRSGGSRIGVVTDMKPVRLEDGSTGAELTLELEKAHGNIPRDSTLRIRPRSALGLKYVEVEMGSSRETFRNGDTVPASQASFATELDEVY
jgi:ABC-type transporter Mla subunit MlaD